MKQLSAFLTLWFVLSVSASAARLSDNLGLKARVGYSIGATAPMGIPASIRSIESFRLTPNILAGVDAALPLQAKWGVQAGLHFENKGMDGEVTTKGYHMKVRMDESEMEGYYTGHVRQKVTQWMLTLPVQATYQAGKAVTLKAGPYVSILLNKDFSGYASEGYLRKDTPTGAKVTMGSTEEERATYDFSEELRTLQLGIDVGADWQLANCFGLAVDLSWGLTGIHKSSFKTIEQTLYPIYGTISITYKLK